jgi:hypothetical protein
MMGGELISDDETRETEDIEQLLSDIFWSEELPDRELIECVRRADEAIPVLMEVLEQCLVSDSVDGQEVPYSLLLLAQLRHRPAFPLFLQLARHPRVHDLLEDMVAENLGRCLAACWDGSVQTLVDLLRDESLDQFVRCQGATALVCLALAGELSRNEVLRAIKDLLRESIDKADPVMPVHCLDAFCELFPDPEAEALIREAYAKDLISSADFNFYEFEEILQEGFDRVWEGAVRSVHNSLVIDAVADSEWWACWECEDPSDTEGGWVPPPVEQLRSDKVGRNDPCPCNSGKKYKKCCGV